jgi:hypothetical protein
MPASSKPSSLEIRAALLGAVVTLWHDRQPPTSSAAQPSPLYAADIERALPLYLRQYLQTTSYDLVPELKKLCKQDPPLLYQVQSYDARPCFVPAWSQLKAYEIILSPPKYLTALVQQLLQATPYPLSGSQLWAACQADARSPIKSRLQLWDTLANWQDHRYRKSPEIDGEYYLYLPTRQQKNWLRYRRLAWAWKRAQLHTEWDHCQGTRHPRLQQGRLLFLQHQVQQLLVVLNSLVTDLPARFAGEGQRLCAELADLRDRCQQRLEQLGLLLPAHFAFLPAQLCTAEEFHRLQQQATYPPLAVPDELSESQKQRFSRSYLVQEVLQQTAIEAYSDQVYYDRGEVLLYLAATTGGPGTRAIADFVRWELGLLRHPVFLFPLLTATDAYERRLALWCLAFLQVPRMSVTYWRLALHDPDKEVRWAALWALQMQGRPLPLKRWQRALADCEVSAAELSLYHVPALRW